MNFLGLNPHPGAPGLRPGCAWSIKFGLFVLGQIGAVSASTIHDPTDISGLVLWADAQDVNGNSTVPIAGAAVSTWTDKSGKGNHLTAPSVAPTYEALGFDGIRPGIRFLAGTELMAGSPFPAAKHPTITEFVVLANVTITNNFATNLNGLVTGSNAANGRFSIHAPWFNRTLYFDAGACCGSSRLSGGWPNTDTETTLLTALNDQPGSRQLLRVDGAAFVSDSSALNPEVSGGVHLGTLGSHLFNGRFAEFILYDRALSLAEVEDVECYLLNRWKPSAVHPQCTFPPQLTFVKTNSVLDITGFGEFALPGNDVVYSIAVTHESGQALDSNSLFLVDEMPAQMSFYNGDIDGAGVLTTPFAFTQSGTSLTFDPVADVGYATGTIKPASMADCTYSPTVGYDSNVSFICFAPKGILPNGTPSPSFSIDFRARLQ